MAEREKAKGSPKIAAFSFLKREKISMKKLLKMLEDLRSQIKLKLKIIFKKTVDIVIKVGVLVSWKEKKARVRRGIKDWAKIEKANIPKQAEVNLASFKPNFPVRYNISTNLSLNKKIN